MLVLSRKKDESIVINNDITIVVVEIRGDKVRLGVEAPRALRSRPDRGGKLSTSAAPLRSGVGRAAGEVCSGASGAMPVAACGDSLSTYTSMRPRFAGKKTGVCAVRAARPRAGALGVLRRHPEPQSSPLADRRPPPAPGFP